MVAPIALVARAVFVARERLKNSSGGAMCGLLDFGDGVMVTITVLTPATDGDETAGAADERRRRRRTIRATGVCDGRHDHRAVE